ncbi:MAG: PKD domain-containing protein [Verrucomicrobiota bacterium]
MKPITMSLLRTGAALCLACGFAGLASAQSLTLRIVCYNIEDDTGATAPLPGLIAPVANTTATTSGGVLEGIGEEVLGDGVAQPVDVLALEETSGNADTVAPIVAGLNAFYGQYNPLASDMYAMAPQGFLTTGTGNGPNAMVYNTKTVQLVATVPVDPPGGTNQLGSASGEYREVMRYEFAPAGQTPTAATEFYVYVSHYKASTGSANEQDRYKEAVIIRTNEATLPANARVLYVGDYNPDSGSSETGYQAIIAADSPNGVSQGQGVDPLNVSGSTTIDWEDSTTNKTILFMLTEEDYELRYRDDLQVCTTNVYSGAAGGLALVGGTYHAFGNNASIAWGSAVTASGNTALATNLAPGSPISASTLYVDLTNASDHLPVVADYTIPVVQPGAVFTAEPTSAVAPLTVTFSDASTGIVTNWLWNFGDGATSNTSTTLSMAHTYTNAGVYSVTETVTGPGGTNTNTQTGLITVLTPFQAWQLQYFGSTNSAQAQPTADADGTGQNNNFKYVAGLNPTNPASIFVFNIASVSNQATWKNLVFSPAVAGRSYTPLFSSAPNSVWTALTTPAPVTNGTQVTLTDTNGVPAQKFYEMEISLP